MRILNVKRAGLAATMAFVALGFARMGYATTTDAQLVEDARLTAGLYNKNAPGIDSFFQRPWIRRVSGHRQGRARGRRRPWDWHPLREGRTGRQGDPESGHHRSPGGRAGVLGIVFFEVPKTLGELKGGKAQLSGQLSAVALTSGAAASTRFKNGVAVFSATKGGLMLEASVGGQKFGYSAF